MKLIRSTVMCGAALLAASLGTGSVLAQGTWNLGGSSCNASGGPPAEASCTVGGVTAGIEAYGNSGAGSSFIQYNLRDYDPAGFGSETASETGAGNHHAFDNVSAGCGGAAGTCGGTTELMLLNFGSSKINLASVSIGFSGGDADLSIYRWDGTSGAVPTGSNLGASWSLVSSMDVDSNGASCTNTNPGGTFCRRFDAASASGAIAGATNLYSSWWLVSTYFGSTNAAKSLESGNDAYKILSFVANTCVGTLTGGSAGSGAAGNNGSSCGPSTPGVSEPGSLALAFLALVGAFASRRKVTARV